MGLFDGILRRRAIAERYGAREEEAPPPPPAPAWRVSIRRDKRKRYRVYVESPEGETALMTVGFGFAERMDARRFAGALMAARLEIDHAEDDGEVAQGDNGREKAV